MSNRSLAERMENIVTASKAAKIATDQNRLPPGFDEATQDMSDKEKTQMLILMNNIATTNIKTRADDKGEVIIPLSVFQGLKLE